MKTNKNKKYKDYNTWLLDELKDQKLALNYLNEALMDEDQRVFLIALKDVLAAQGQDMSALAKDAHITRQNLYRILSAQGNPRWSNLSSLCNVLGFQVQLSAKNN